MTTGRIVGKVRLCEQVYCPTDTKDPVGVGEAPSATLLVADAFCVVLRLALPSVVFDSKTGHGVQVCRL